MRKNDPADVKEVRRVPKRANVSTGRPSKIITSAMRAKTAYPSTGGSMLGSGGNFYSPELSTDFLELPQSVDELRHLFRFFYRTEPFVGQAIDQQSELPLSKLRLGLPKARNKKLAKQSLRFCQKWAREIGLLHRLIEIVHEYFLIGEVFIFAEDTSPDMPRSIRERQVREIAVDGSLREFWEPYEDADARAVEWLKRNYTGWTAIRVLPPEQVKMEAFPFTDQKLMELIPDSKTKSLINQADQGDNRARKIVDSMPAEVVEAVRNGENIPLSTDPEGGSFVHYMARKKSQYEPRGYSILERCLRTLIFRDKLRQSQTSIASRHMTPYRLIYGDDLSEANVEELREQVDMALQDPDFSIITSFQVNWEERGGGQENRLLDLTSEYELTDRQLYAGLGVTESLLSGEGSYGGDKINLEVINTRYMLLREVLQDFVEKYLFRPMCARMGFIEDDEDGIPEVVTPRLSFTRLALRDNSDTFDALFNLYQKNSLSIDVILDLLNIDADEAREKLEKDKFTMNDATFNELLRGIYTDAASKISENSDVVEMLAKNLGLHYVKPKEDEGGRF